MGNLDLCVLPQLQLKNIVAGEKLTAIGSTNLKATLLISYDYLRLYTNAFAFQATFRRPRASKNKQQTPQRPAFVCIASDPDARFIYEALDAAKSLLVTVNNFVDPETCLRYMPLRFYLYESLMSSLSWKSYLTYALDISSIPPFSCTR